MRVRFTILPLFISAMAFAQAPSGYYDGTEGLRGEELKTKLSEIITRGHRDRGYDALFSGYEKGDVDKFYENDGTVLDIYSENPNGKDPYNFNFSKKCGNYTGESSCYNREHIVPQSTLSNAIMKNDFFQVLPTDGYVNNRRSNFVFANVRNATWTSLNGSKLGASGVSGYSGTAFEPIDEFKGDVARILLYFATRYEKSLGRVSFNMFGNQAYPGLSSWALPMLLQWNAQDPVSEREKVRNDAGFDFQGNRNPFVDNPNFVNLIWGNSTAEDTQAPTAPVNLVANTSATTSTSVSLSWGASTDNVAVTQYEIYVDGVKKSTANTTTATITGLNPKTTYSFYIIAKDAVGNASPASNVVSVTTLEGVVTPPTNNTTCGTEDFENMPASQSSYATRTWANNNITWTATEARTDEKINNSRAITMKSGGSLTSSSISGGISSLTVTVQRKFSGSNGKLNLLINGENKGDIDFTANVQNKTIENINVEGNIIIEIKNASGQRVAVDNLSWTCYSSLSINENTKVNNKITVAPNPVKGNEITITNVNEGELVKIFSINGRLVQTDKVTKNGKLKLKNLAKGIYLVSVKSQTIKIIVE